MLRRAVLEKASLVVMTSMMLAIAGMRMAVADYREDLKDYYQYRFHSGLPGNNSGVTVDGQVGPDGATQMAIPVAYTPSKGNYVVNPNLGMRYSGLSGLDLSYHGAKVNGTLNLGFGMGRPGRGFYAAYMMTGKNRRSLPGEPAYNWQWQLSSGIDERPAIAIGGLDMINQRPATLDRPKAGDARSFYMVATEQYGDEQNPFYVTAGLGTGRFKGLFGGISYRLEERTSVFGEYDSLGINAGMTYGLSRPSNRHNVVLFLGVADARFLSYGVTYTHRDK